MHLNERQQSSTGVIISQKRTYRQYLKEFREEVVALVREQGYCVPDVVKSLGIETNMLYNWTEKVKC